jgi:hypothetical protein
MLAASGIDVAPPVLHADDNRRAVVQRLRDAVVSIVVSA